MAAKGEVRFEFKGTSDLLKKLRKIPGAKEAATQSLVESAERTMARSKEDFVPVDTGTLRSTGRVELVRRGKSVGVKLLYGGPAAPYAIFVHEIDKNYRVGGWKYIETPLKQDIPKYEKKMVRDLNRFFKSL